MLSSQVPRTRWSVALRMMGLGLTVAFASCASAPPAPQWKEVVVEDALPLQVTTEYPGGDVSGIVINRYNEVGRLLSSEKTNAAGVVTERRTGSPTETGWLVTVTSGSSAEVTSQEIQSFDANGFLVKQVYVNAKGEPQASNEYVYLGEKKLEWLAKTGADVVQARTVYTYDTSDRLVTVTLYDGGGKLTDTISHEWSTEGVLVSSTRTNAAGAVQELTVYTFDELGRKIKEETQKPSLKAFEYEYAQGKYPVAVRVSVRGKPIERQVIETLVIPRTVKVPL